MDQHMFNSAGADATDGMEGGAARDAERARDFTTSEEAAAKAGSSFARAAIDMFVDEHGDSNASACTAQHDGRAADATERAASGPESEASARGAEYTVSSAGEYSSAHGAAEASNLKGELHGDRLASTGHERAYDPLAQKTRETARYEAGGSPAFGTDMYSGEEERAGATLSAWSSAEDIARAVGAEYTGGSQAMDDSTIEGGMAGEFDAADAGVFRDSDIDGEAVARGFQSRSRMLRESGVGDASVAGEFEAVEEGSPAGAGAVESDISSEFSGSGEKAAQRAEMFDAASSRTPFSRKAVTLGRDTLEAELHNLASSGSGDSEGAAGSVIGNAAVSAAFKKDAKSVAGAAVNAILDDSDEEVATAADMVRKGRASVKTAKMAGRKIAEFRARGQARKVGRAAQRAQRKSMAIARGIKEGRAVSGMGLSARIKSAAAAAGTGVKTGIGGAAKALMGFVATGPGAIVVVLLAFILLFGGGGQGSQGVGALTGVEAQVAQFFKDKGLEDVQIAAIMGNMFAESGMDPGKHQGGGGGFGICQWDGGRKTNLYSYAASVGKPASDLQVQLDFFWDHDIWQGSWFGSYVIKRQVDTTDPPVGAVVSGAKSRFLATADVEQATKEFCYGWERPGIPHIKKRIDAAKGYLEAMSNGLSGQDLADANERQKAVAKAAVASTYSTSTGMCQAFVCRAYKAAGESNDSRCCAHAAGDAWVVSTSKANIPVGATVYVSRSASGTSCGCGRDAGHVGIYIGGGKVASRRDGNAPYIETLDHFADNWGRGGWMGWGWNGGIPLA